MQLIVPSLALVSWFLFAALAPTSRHLTLLNDLKSIIARVILLQLADFWSFRDVVHGIWRRKVRIRFLLDKLLLPFLKIQLRLVFGSFRTELVSKVKLPNFLHFHRFWLWDLWNLAFLLFYLGCGFGLLQRWVVLDDAWWFNEIDVSSILGNYWLPIVPLILFIVIVLFILLLELELVDRLVLFHRFPHKICVLMSFLDLRSTGFVQLNQNSLIFFFLWQWPPIPIFGVDVFEKVDHLVLIGYRNQAGVNHAHLVLICLALSNWLILLDYRFILGSFDFL